MCVCVNQLYYVIQFVPTYEKYVIQIKQKQIKNICYRFTWMKIIKASKPPKLLAIFKEIVLFNQASLFLQFLWMKKLDCD